MQDVAPLHRMCIEALARERTYSHDRFAAAWADVFGGDAAMKAAPLEARTL